MVVTDYELAKAICHFHGFSTPFWVAAHDNPQNEPHMLRKCRCMFG
jgi:hypothetical protein